MYASLLPWMVLMLNLCTLSMPFVAFNVFKCQSTDPDAPAPFTHYQDITSGLNLCVASVYASWSEYFFFGQVLLGLGFFMATLGYLNLRRWYSDNPQYTARLF